MNPTEPLWKSYIVETLGPIFTPKQCQMVIDKGMSLKKETAAVGMGNPKGSGVDTKKRITTISWIPFKVMPEMYRDIETTMLKANGNHFGFDGMRLTEPGQFTHYLEGGELEFMSDGKTAKLKQGQAIFFASWLQHRVKPVTKGERKSLVMWFGGPSFK